MKHGRAMYAKGCRCKRCKRARRDAGRRYRAGERAPVPSSCVSCGGPLEQKGGNPRLYCSDRCRPRHDQDVCECGAPKSKVAERCQRCAGVVKRDLERRATVERLWAEGKSIREIAVAVGWANVNVASGRIHEMRQQGADLPYRRSEAARARMAAAAARRAA